MRLAWSGVASTAVLLQEDNIDTDQVVPARFLATTRGAGFAEALFANRRQEPGFPLNRAGADVARILVAGSNFGCGSSREHAVWALIEWGFEAVIAPSFGDIFRQNALRNGLLPATVSRVTWETLAASLQAHPTQTIDVRLLPQEIQWQGGSGQFDLNPFGKQMILQGLDDLELLLTFKPAVADFEMRNDLRSPSA